VRLESARDLKQEILEGIIRPLSEAGSAGGEGANRASFQGIARVMGMQADFSVAAGPRNTAPSIQRSLALGLTRHERQYRLAVRVQRQSLIQSQLVEHIVRQAKNEVDVRFIGRVEKRTGLPPALPWHRGSCRPHLIGCSTGHVDVTAGTLGAFVRRTSDQRLFALSNNHVFANENRAKPGDKLLQPGRSDGGKPPRDIYAELGHSVKLEAKARNVVDAALGILGVGPICEPTLLREIYEGMDRHLNGLGPDFLDEGSLVYKVGRTTGATKGRVTAFELDDVIVTYDIGNLPFDNQIEIEGIEVPFSDGGDSGALIVNEEMQAVALLFAGTEVGGQNGLGLTYANPIQTVLAKLGVELAC
jgi:hypothetical protein